ncbi:MAG TPA: hypothetical protein EYH09_01995 [Candidatus Nanopusillus sp.]|nr:hypothetical protein [Candidatus Nanopusillus sp.]
MAKLLISADLHNDPSLLKKIIESIKKEKPDFLVLLGDLGEFGELPTGLFKKLLKYMPSYRIIVLPGNHETPETIEFWEKIYKVRVLHKKTFEFYDLLFAGIGGGDVPLFMISEEEIKEFLNYVKEKIKDKKLILLTHLHPKYTKSSMVGGGSKALHTFITYYTPSLVAHGHIHEAGGLEEIINKTKVLNAARSIFLVEILNDNIKIKRFA